MIYIAIILVVGGWIFAFLLWMMIEGNVVILSSSNNKWTPPEVNKNALPNVKICEKCGRQNP